MRDIHFPDLPPFFAIRCPVGGLLSPRHSPITSTPLGSGWQVPQETAALCAGRPAESAGRPEAQHRASDSLVHPTGGSSCPSARQSGTPGRRLVPPPAALPPVAKPVRSLRKALPGDIRSHASRRVRKRIKSHQAETVVANGDPVTEGDALRDGMRTGLLFCRRRGLFCSSRLFRSV
jgi:hypothetical protein